MVHPSSAQLLRLGEDAGWGEDWGTLGDQGQKWRFPIPHQAPGLALTHRSPGEESWRGAANSDAQAASVFHTDTQFWVEIRLWAFNHTVPAHLDILCKQFHFWSLGLQCLQLIPQAPYAYVTDAGPINSVKLP